MFPPDFGIERICYKVFPMSTTTQGPSGEDIQLLVVDDDPGIRDLLCRYLGEQGFRIAAVEDGKSMDAWLAENTPDLVILDLMLPGEDGLSLARRLRGDHQLPIIMISARGEEVDRIVGLEVGADDYLPKPFSPRELLARIRAVLRRNSPIVESEPSAAAKYVFGPFRLEPDKRRCITTQQKLICREPSSSFWRFSWAIRIGFSAGISSWSVSAVTIEILSIGASTCE